MARVLHITTIWLCGVKTFAGVEVREADVGEVPLGMVDGENFVEVWSRKINKNYTRNKLRPPTSTLISDAVFRNVPVKGEIHGFLDERIT